MPIVSVCLVSNISHNYDFLDDQNWTDVELVISGNKDKSSFILESLYKNTSIGVVKIVELNELPFNENTLIRECEGEYIVWLENNETWNPDFLNQLKDFIHTYRKTEAVLYGLGFTKKGQSLIYSSDQYNVLRNRFSLNKVLFYPYFFMPLVKFLWKRDLIQEYSLLFDTTLNSRFARVAAFNLNYLTTIYQNNAYNEPSYICQPLSFYLPNDIQTSTKFLRIYQEMTLNKSAIFRGNPWSKLYWQFLFAQYVLRKKLSPKDKLLES